MNLIEKFNKVRDVPYRIPLTLKEPDNCCTGKSKRLFEIFQPGGYQVRYRIGIIRWSDLQLPSEILSIPHDDESSHTYLEININGEWKIIDATWDSKLRGTYVINDWDGKSDTHIAFPIRKCIAPKKSVEYIQHISKTKAILADLKINRGFYQAVNEWLEKQRKIKFSTITTA